MNEPCILPVKPGSLSNEDKTALRGVGVIVVEHDNPDELRLLRPTVDVDSSDMLACAMKAMCGASGDISVRAAFTSALGAVIAKCNEGK